MNPVPQHPEPRRHHYVPRCWLAGFTVDGGKDGRLWVTDLVRRRQWPSTPDNTGHIRDFYRLPDPAPDPIVVERFFSVLEDEVAPLLRDIDQDRRDPFDDELDLLLHLMAYQWVRVPRFRPIVFEVMDRFVRKRLATALRSRQTWRATLVEAGLDPNAPGAGYEPMQRFFESGEWDLTVETDWYMQKAFADAERILESLRERYWTTSFTHRGRLIASDNPVVMDGERGAIIGFGNAEFVLYPLSRHAVLVGTLKRIQRPVENLNYFAQTNTMMLLQADSQVFSPVPDFSWLDENRNHQTDWSVFAKDRF